MCSAIASRSVTCIDSRNCCYCVKMLDESEERTTPQGVPYKELPYFVNEDGNYIFCRYWEPKTKPRALVMIVHGAAEHSGRYTKVVEMLVNQSLFVFAHDHVGHGQSEGKRMAVSDFSVYVRDCLQHIDIVKTHHSCLKLFLFAHSMGGLIAIYIIDERPEDIAGVIFMAPLLLMNPEAATPVKVFIARVFYRLLPNVALGHLDPYLLTKEENEVLDYINDPLNYHGPVRVRFAAAVLNAVINVEKVLPTILTPMLILHSEEDKVCDIMGSYLIFNIAASMDKEFKVFMNCYHQLHKESPIIVREMFTLIENWFNDRLPEQTENVMQKLY
uniref:monoglyceride lipase-like isoform X1 n=1 Tax=Pristiophorus japonicus TaxID=55135 RepID=UPI00398F8658